VSIKIEKNKPLPCDGYAGFGYSEEFRRVLLKMKPLQDSIVIDSQNKRQNALLVARKMKIKVATREDHGRYRLWRLPDDWIRAGNKRWLPKPQNNGNKT
jgi:hypothetical protein